MKKIISIFILAIFTSACALTDATLPISAQNVNTGPGPISQVSPKIFNFTNITDSRPTKLIGQKTNGFGMKTADVSSEIPVERIVAESFAKMLYVNGHGINSNDSDIDIEINVKKFEFNNKVNFASMETTALVETSVKLLDSKTLNPLLDKTYMGNSYQKSFSLYLENWDQMLTLALQNMINQASVSPEFKDAISK